ncbi:glycosyltransferase family 1 protein, partial [Paenibacillus phytohabitans]
MDDKENYDFIFVRNRQLALDLIRINEKLASKMLYLSIQYDEDDRAMMEEMDYLFKNSKMIFFQSVPWAERFKDYVCRNG